MNRRFVRNGNRGRYWLPAALALAVLTAACGSGTDTTPEAMAAPATTGDSEAGTGFLDVGDIDGTPLAAGFTARPVPLNGRVAARADGCVTVVVDGVERVPLWPEGTTLEQRAEKHYVVRLAGGVTLSANGGSGDRFEAAGIVHHESGTATPKSTDPPGKAESFLAFCGVKAPPVAFPDATTFKTP
jgi:hypothetical protein